MTKAESKSRSKGVVMCDICKEEKITTGNEVRPAIFKLWDYDTAKLLIVAMNTGKVVPGVPINVCKEHLEKTIQTAYVTRNGVQQIKYCYTCKMYTTFRYDFCLRCTPIANFEYNGMGEKIPEFQINVLRGTHIEPALQYLKKVFTDNIPTGRKLPYKCDCGKELNRLQNTYHIGWCKAICSDCFDMRVTEILEDMFIKNAGRFVTYPIEIFEAYRKKY